MDKNFKNLPREKFRNYRDYPIISVNVAEVLFLSFFKLFVQLNPGSSSPPGGDLLHVRAVGENDTLHYLFCSQGAPTLLLVHTNSSSSAVKVCFSC